MYLEYQPISIIHTLYKEGVECTFDVATEYNKTMSIEYQQSLNAQRNEKLKMKELKNQEGLDRSQKKLIDAKLWEEKFESLALNSSREVIMKL